MIEPTDEMEAAFNSAAAAARTMPRHEGYATRDGIAAVLRIVERDYRIEPRPPRERRPATCPVHHTQLRWGQCAECGPDES